MSAAFPNMEKIIYHVGKNSIFVPDLAFGAELYSIDYTSDFSRFSFKRNTSNNQGQIFPNNIKNSGIFIDMGFPHRGNNPAAPICESYSGFLL